MPTAFVLFAGNGAPSPLGRLPRVARPPFEGETDIAIIPDLFTPRMLRLQAAAIIVEWSGASVDLEEYMAATGASIGILTEGSSEPWLALLVEALAQGEDWSSAIARSVPGARPLAQSRGPAMEIGNDMAGPSDDDDPPRFLQTRASEKESGDEVRALIHDRDYEIAIRVAPDESGWVTSTDAVPEETWRPDEESRQLTVLFHEPAACPDGASATITLPRRGSSETAVFGFRLAVEQRNFDARISIFHGNRPLIECGLRIAIGAGPEPTLRTLMRTRAFDSGFRNFSEAAGTIRIEDEVAHAIRGTEQDRKVFLSGYKDAVQAMEKAVNAIALEEISPAAFLESEDAARLLIALARQGCQFHDQLMQSKVVRDIFAESGKLITVIAADAETRAPFELCYSLPEPASKATICPAAARAAARGSCEAGCAGSGDPENYVCPAGFWGLRRCIEWRSLEADEDNSGQDPDRAPLDPLRQVLIAHSERVASTARLDAILAQSGAAVAEAGSWKEWRQAVQQRQPSLLLLMPHVDKRERPPVMEIHNQPKDPPGVKPNDIGSSDPPPVVLLLGCGAASFSIDFQSLPNQFRRGKAAVVVAPAAEILARDAPELAAALVREFRANTGAPLAQAVLAAKRSLVSEGFLSGLLLLSFGDADWRL